MKFVVMIIPFLLIVIRHALILFIGKQYEMYFDYQWVKFKLDYSKSYESFEKELHHYRIFQKTLKEIEEHNEKFEAGLVKWKEGINQFSDLSEQESDLIDLEGLGDVKVKPKFYNHLSHVINGNAPRSIDWREFNALTPVKRQTLQVTQPCGCCWAMSVTSAVESHYAIKNKKLIELSVQELIDCSREKRNNGCEGGITYNAFKYVVSNGLNTEESYPYEAKRGTCRKTKSKVKITGYTRVPRGESYLKDAVGTVGPVSVCLKFGPLTKYQGGIFKCPIQRHNNVTHAVLLVGYGEEDGVPYWLLRNSWGDNWGEKGYFRIERGYGIPVCGIHLYPYYPNVEITEGEEEDDPEYKG